MDEAELLDGWKEIAGYLGRSVRSAQRWESQLALPVHRIPTPDGGHVVYARRAEIDAWREQQGGVNGHAHAPDTGSDPDGPRGGPAGAGNGLGRLPPVERAGAADDRPPTRWWLGGVTLLTIANLAAAAVLLTTWGDRRAGVGRYEIEGQSVRAFTEAGRTVWTFDVGRAVTVPPTLRGGPPVRQVDLDRDGRSEVIAVVRETLTGAGRGTSDVLYALSDDGTVRWRVEPRIVLRDNIRQFEPPWIIRHLLIDDETEEPVLYAAFSHASWRPSIVLRVTADGEASVRYLQDGWVYALAMWTASGGRYLAAGGAVSTHDRPSVALVPVGGDGARFTVDPANALRCDTCPEQPPAQVLLFPNSDVTRAMYRPFGWVWLLRVMDGRLRVSIDAGFGEGSVAYVDASGRVVDYRFAARYWEAHRQLFDERRLDHNADACPHLHEPHVFDEWTPEHKTWRRYQVRAAAGAQDEVRQPAD